VEELHLEGPTNNRILFQ